MRSSKSRSRSKSNRQRSLGNIVNRVFDSSGPEGKVRGTPQQIIDKYLMLARDAQLSNDRVAEQNFLQHAEHYTRMLGEAQREMAREQEGRQGGHGQGQGGQSGGQGGQQNGHNGGNQNGGHNGHQNGGHQNGQPAQAGRQPQQGQNPQQNPQQHPQPSGQQPRIAEAPAALGFAVALETSDETDSGLVETPEERGGFQGLPAAGPARGAPPQQQPEARDSVGPAGEGEAPRAAKRRPRGPKPEGTPEGAPEGARAAEAQAVGEDRPKRAPRKPRAPKPAAQETVGGED